MAFRRAMRRKLRKRFTLGGVISTAGRVLPAAGMALASKNPLPFVSQLASEAKRFIQNLVDDTTGGKFTVTNTTNFRQVLTLVPRNITSADAQVDNRVTRKCWVKGLWLRLQIESGIATGYQSVRVLVVRSQNSFEDISATQFYAPVASTRGVQVIFDKYYNITGKTDGNGRSSMTLSRFIKVNKKLLYAGTTIDGTDTDMGTLTIYVFSNDPQGIQCIGASTLSYRELN